VGVGDEAIAARFHDAIEDKRSIVSQDIEILTGLILCLFELIA